jgi:molybdopterin-guanine dinucleotide biosynthesis protein A
MGTDKARLKLGEKTFVERIFEALTPLVTATSLISSNSRTANWGIPVITDVFEGWGALGGLHSALSACDSTWALVVACDLPLVTNDLFVRLASFREGNDAVAPIQRNGYLQPLCTLYRTEPCRKCAEELIASGDRRPRSLLSAVRTRWVAFSEIEDLDGSEGFFANINTPADFDEIRRLVKGEKRKPSGN